jgi:hypothetical protein
MSTKFSSSYNNILPHKEAIWQPLLLREGNDTVRTLGNKFSNEYWHRGWQQATIGPINLIPN